MKSKNNSENITEFKRDNEFIWFMCQMLIHLKHIERTTKLIHTPDGEHATDFVPMEKSEIIKLPFDHSGLYEKVCEWVSSEAEILYLNQEEMKIFKLGRDAVYLDHMKENSWMLSQNSFVKYYIKHYLELEQ